jgi:hypothetical protein
MEPRELRRRAKLAAQAVDDSKHPGAGRATWAGTSPGAPSPTT